jgi:hypothetical protein
VFFIKCLFTQIPDEIFVLFMTQIKLLFSPSRVMYRLRKNNTQAKGEHIMKTKNIKVLYATRTRENPNHAWHQTTYIETPKIQMEGKWLEALGFHIGDRLQVDYEEGAIHIRLAPMGPQPAMVCEAQTEYSSSSKKTSKKQK